MAIAGKVAITPGYEWSVDVAYDKLVVVTFANNVYLSTKPSTGIEPTNEEYWMLLIENVTAEDLAELQTIVENIIIGTTSVGKAKDSDTVDGWHIYNSPTEFGKTTSSTMSEIYLAMPPQSVFIQDAGKLTDASWKFPITVATLVIIKPFSYRGWLELRHKKENGGFYHMGVSDDSMPVPTGNWSTQFLPLTGGTLTGNVKVDRGTFVGAFQSFRTLPSGARQFAQYWCSENSANMAVYDENDITSPLAQLLVMNSKISYRNSNGDNTILHTGNKPTGSYTGNGDETERTINVGGIGNVLLISRAQFGMVFVFKNYCYIIKADGTITQSQEATFSDGVLTIKSKGNYLNANGGVFPYQVL